MAYHAKLSPSGYARWSACPGSVVLSEGVPDEGSSYADEGTAAHYLAAWCLSTGGNPEDQRGNFIRVGIDGESIFVLTKPSDHPSAFEVGDDMIKHVGRYVAAVRQQAEGGVVLVEQKVPISSYTFEDGATGISDAIVVTRDGELQIHDLKYGMGKPVEAEGNGQLQLYALGAVEELELAYDFDHVRLFIHQPRIGSGIPSEWGVTLAELDDFGDEVKEAAALVKEASEFGGPTNSATFADAYLVAGEGQCLWCRVKATCPELSKFIADTVGAEFEDLDGVKEVVSTLDQGTPEELATKLAAAPLIEQWLKAVRAKVESELLAGNVIPGYKLVRGKMGNRQWNDPTEAEALLKSMRLKTEEMYDLKLISPTTAEKLSQAAAEGEKPIIGPRQWKKVQEIIVRKEGGLSVAPASDKREAVNPAAKADDFDDLGDDLV